MDYERINAALKAASDTRCVTIQAGALAAVDATFAQCFENRPAVVVADATTYRVAGQQVEQRMAAAGRKLEPPIVVPAQPAL